MILCSRGRDRALARTPDRPLHYPCACGGAELAPLTTVAQLTLAAVGDHPARH